MHLLFARYSFSSSWPLSVLDRTPFSSLLWSGNQRVFYACCKQESWMVLKDQSHQKWKSSLWKKRLHGSVVIWLWHSPMSFWGIITGLSENISSDISHGDLSRVMRELVMVICIFWSTFPFLQHWAPSAKEVICSLRHQELWQCGNTFCRFPPTSRGRRLD